MASCPAFLVGLARLVSPALKDESSAIYSTPDVIILSAIIVSDGSSGDVLERQSARMSGVVAKQLDGVEDDACSLHIATILGYNGCGTD